MKKAHISRFPYQKPVSCRNLQPGKGNTQEKSCGSALKKNLVLLVWFMRNLKFPREFISPGQKVFKGLVCTIGGYRFDFDLGDIAPIIPLVYLSCTWQVCAIPRDTKTSDTALVRIRMEAN
ncbi:hypothetical protein TWF694_006580 [Orbilia ellipsospora]|uniref:Uncharacterized protein n=1 Tax=Orbilia ellipsospora TaxID=2528407 RepID=A0AAV9XM35_9PEZI